MARKVDTRDVRDGLEGLAKAFGVEVEYRSVGGERIRAGPETLLKTLVALGAPMDDERQAPTALRDVRAARAERWLPPVVVVWEGSPLEVETKIPGSSRDVECRLELEQGEVREWKAAVARGPGGDGAGPRLSLPDGVPLGIHRLRVERPGGGGADSRVIHAPRRVHRTEGRDWGLFLPLYALRGGADWGIGDLTGLASFRTWAASRRAAWVGTLPILATYLDRPFDPSPYSPVSRLFWNEIYADPTRSPDLERSSEARELLDSAAFLGEVTTLRRGDLVDHRWSYVLKRKALELLARAAWSDGSRAGSLAALAEERPEWMRYARFRASMEHRDPDWWERSRGSDQGSDPLEKPLEEAARVHLYAQWLVERQLAGSGDEVAGRAAQLYLDLPLGCHARGFDTWRWPELFADGVTVGAPPDLLASGGQDWGFPPVAPEAGRRDGHRYWRASLGKLARPSGALRIDHVMALHRQWWIPEGMPASEGVYVRNPAEEMFAVLALESRRHRCRIIGEDLGTVPDEVRESMARHGLLRMYVLPFELGDDGVPSEVPEDALASLNTHDTYTFSGFVRGADLNAREGAAETDAARKRVRRDRRERAERVSGLARWLLREGFLDSGSAPDRPSEAPDEGSLLRACLAFLASSPARLVLVNLEDLWLEERPQNVPAGAGGEDNWKRRIPYDLPRVEELSEVMELLAEVRRWREGSVGDDGRSDGTSVHDDGPSGGAAADDHDRIGG